MPPTASAASPGFLRRLNGLVLDRLVLRSLSGLAVRAAEVVGKLLLYILVAHRLGAWDAGRYFVAMTVLTLGSSLARLGFERSIVRHLPAALAVGHVRAAARMLGWTAACTLLGVTVVGGLTAVLAQPAALHLFGKPDYTLPFLMAAALLVPDALAITAGAVLIGLKRPIAAQLVQNSLWPPMVLACVAAGLDQVQTVLLATVACRAITAVLGLLLIWQRRPVFRSPAQEAPPAPVLRDLWRTARPLYVVELVQGTFITIPILVLGAFADDAAVGAFSAASRLSMLTWVVLLSIGTVMAPHISVAHHTEQWAELRRLNRKARLLSALAAMPPLLLMMAFPAPILDVVGPGFSRAAVALEILALGQVVNAVLSCQDTLLAMAGHGRVLRLLSLMQLATCLVLSGVLIPFLGVIGAALAIGISTAQGAIGPMLVARRLVPQAF